MGDIESAAALAIIREWDWRGWDLRSGGILSHWLSLNDAVNALAFDGHADPAGASLELLIDGALIARGTYHWRACRNGDRFSQQDNGIISANWWCSVRDGLAKRDWVNGGNVTLPLLDVADALPAEWDWNNNRIILAHRSGNDEFCDNYSEEWFSAWNIEVHCPPADTAAAKRDIPSSVEADDGPPTKPAVPTLRRSGGRPQKYDWEGALAHVAAVANTVDGLETGPGGQAAIERLIADYFMQASDDGACPCESEIRKRANRVMSALDALELSLSKVA